MSTIVLSNDWAKYSSTDFWTINNVANKGSLKNGIDYTQTITVDTDTFPSNTRLSWSWPDTFNPMTFAYPEVVVGYKPWDNFGPTNYTSQINAIQDFKIDYNLTLGGQTDNYNVAFTMWLTDEANGQRDDITHEVMVWVHDGNMNPAGTKVGFYDGPTFDADIWVNPSHGDTAGGSGVIWKYIALETTTDVLAGQIDMKALLLDLKAKGIITGTEYVNGYELGAEIAGRTGSLTINSLNQTFSTTTTPVTPPPSPPPPASTIVLSNDWAKYSSTDFWTINNVANKGSLKNGIDYTQTITVDTDTFPSNTRLSWSWPDTFNPMTFAYPEVVVGYKPWDNFGPTNYTSQINAIQDFKIDYNLTLGGQTDNYNVAFTMWLTDEANGQRDDITHEVMVWVHDGNMNPAGTKVGFYDGPTFDADIWVNPSHGDTAGGSGVIWKYIALETTTDVLAGQIDMKALLLDLKAKGIITGTEYVNGYELGAEIAGRTGSLTINSLNQTFSTTTTPVTPPPSPPPAPPPSANITGTAANDTLTGTAANNIISGLAGNDILYGLGGNDTLYGGEGHDWLDGGTGTDNMGGGAGNDVYVVDNAGDIADESVAGSAGIDTVQSSISFSLVNTSRLLGAVENLALLGSGNISGTGNALSNLITGNAGANVLNGSSGADNMRGGAGNDVYIVDNAGDIVNESLAGSTGIDTVQSSISFSLSNSAQVLGTVENLTLLGSAAIGGTGNALANTIVGNAAANVVNGAAGNDRIIGGGGNDTLLGSTGIDTVTGDLGNDIFRFVETPTAANRDIITDFANVAGNNDTFQLENAVFTTLGAGAAHPLNSAFFWSNTTGLAHDANDHVIYNRSTGALYYDSNGTAAGGSVQIATLTNRTALTAADFTVI